MMEEQIQSRFAVQIRRDAGSKDFEGDSDPSLWGNQALSLKQPPKRNSQLELDEERGKGASSGTTTRKGDSESDRKKILYDPLSTCAICVVRLLNLHSLRPCPTWDLCSRDSRAQVSSRTTLLPSLAFQSQRIRGICRLTVHLP
jgi:hypothetical protein